jgi:hypothetical protein
MKIQAQDYGSIKTGTFDLDVILSKFIILFYSMCFLQVTPAPWWGTSCCKATSTLQRTMSPFTPTSLDTSHGFVKKGYDTHHLK